MSLLQQAETAGTLVREMHGPVNVLRLYWLPDNSGIMANFEPDGRVWSWPLTAADMTDTVARWDESDEEMSRRDR